MSTRGTSRGGDGAAGLLRRRRSSAQWDSRGSRANAAVKLVGIVLSNSSELRMPLGNVDVPGVADGDGGAQQRTSHGVRAGEGVGTRLENC